MTKRGPEIYLCEMCHPTGYSHETRFCAINILRLINCNLLIFSTSSQINILGDAALVRPRYTEVQDRLTEGLKHVREIRWST